MSKLLNSLLLNLTFCKAIRHVQLLHPPESPMLPLQKPRLDNTNSPFVSRPAGAAVWFNSFCCQVSPPTYCVVPGWAAQGLFSLQRSGRNRCCTPQENLSTLEQGSWRICSAVPKLSRILVLSVWTFQLFQHFDTCCIPHGKPFNTGREHWHKCIVEHLSIQERRIGEPANSCSV